MKPTGTRIQVYTGLAVRTSGGLKKKNLAKNKYGKIVSKKKQAMKSNLTKFLTTKGGKPKAVPPKPKVVPPKPKAKPKKKKLGSKKTPVVDLTSPPASPKKKKLGPMKAGEKKNLAEVLVGNIMTKKQKEDAELQKYIKKWKKEGMTDAEIEALLKGGRMPKAAKVQRALKASKRKGKRRTKKQLLQDVIDL